MNTDKFTHGKGTFDALDLSMRFKFKSPSSIGFKFATKQAQHTIIGEMQIHQPCEGHIKARVYIQLPSEYKECKLLVQILEAAFRELGIPPDETYELSFDNSEDGLFTCQPLNREGLTDRTGNWTRPRSPLRAI
jgi:hypothetical protein